MRRSSTRGGPGRRMRLAVVALVLTVLVGCPEEEGAGMIDIPDIELPDSSAPSDKGACCLPNGTCDDAANRASCDERGGFWHGIGSVCADVAVCNSSGPFDDKCDRARSAEGLGPWSLNTRENRSDAEGTIPRTGGCRRIWRDAVACWTAPQDGTVVIETCSETSTVNTVLAVYRGCECPLTLDRLMACNDDADGCANGQSQVSVSVAAGQSYMIHTGESFDEPEGGRVDVRARYVEATEPSGNENSNQNSSSNPSQNENANSTQNQNSNANESANSNTNTNSSTAPGSVDLVVQVRNQSGEPVGGAFVIVSVLPAFEQLCSGNTAPDGHFECESQATGRQINVFAGIESPGGFLEGNVQTVIVNHASGTMIIEVTISPP